jgi:hypothetical protein
MPEAARERTVSFRARAPHSLRIREYPRPKASFTERDSWFVTEVGTIVKCSRYNRDIAGFPRIESWPKASSRLVRLGEPP